MKRAISITVLICMLSGLLTLGAQAFTFTQVDETYTLGDVNGDSTVNAKDTYELKAHIANGTDVVADAADLNADGAANARDNLLLKAVNAGARAISDFESDSIIYKMTVASNSISDYDIVIPDNAVYNKESSGNNDNCTYAAELLQEYIRKATGVSLNIVVGESTKAHMIYCHNIDVNSEEAEALGLGIENYIYEVKNGDLHIYGTLRGCMYAAYEILEEYLGISFYSEIATYFPTKRTADIPEGTYVYHQVPLEFRFSGQTANTDTACEYYFPRRLNGTQLYAYWGRRNGYATGPYFCNAHSYSDYYLMGTGYDPGPDYPDIKNRYYVKWRSRLNDNTYPYTDIRANRWQPCASPFGSATLESDAPSDYAYMFQGMLEALQMMTDWGNDLKTVTELGIHIASASINDNGNSCDCRICSAKANGRTLRITGDIADKLDGYTGEYTVNGKDVTFKKESYSGVYLDLTKRFGRDIQEYYPGVRVMTIIYDHTVPESVRPDENIVLMYCGHGCNQHPFGSGECGDGKTLLGGSNTHDEEELMAWANFCHEAGATIWFWEYGVNYHYYLAPCPNVMDFWQSYHYILEVCGCDGIFYEGSNYIGNREGAEEYSFEGLKGYLSERIMWEPSMTYERFIEVMKEYLYMYYGDGYEYVYEYLQYQQASGDANEICCIVNYDRPWEMYSKAYIAEHYEEARAFLDKALAMAKEDIQRERVEKLYLSCDFLGLCSVYDDMYTNGTDAQRAVYEERYSALWTYLYEHEYPIFSSDDYTLPDEIDYTVNPMIQFYDHGSNRAGVKP